MMDKKEFAGMKPMHVVEAALFSAGRPLAAEEIAEQTGLARPAVRQAIDALKAAYEERDTVLEVGKAGTKWGMQVKTTASEPAARFAPMEIPKKLLKTLALIAYHQPMKQSELSDMIGSKVYDHVGELKERGLIRTRRDGITKILTTTAEFPEYFGLDAATPDQIRAVLAKMVGLEPPVKDKGQGSLAAFDAPAPEAKPEDGETVVGDAPPAETRPEPEPEVQEIPAPAGSLDRVVGEARAAHTDAPTPPPQPTPEEELGEHEEESVEATAPAAE